MKIMPADEVPTQARSTASISTPQASSRGRQQRAGRSERQMSKTDGASRMQDEDDEAGHGPAVSARSTSVACATLPPPPQRPAARGTGAPRHATSPAVSPAGGRRAPPPPPLTLRAESTSTGPKSAEQEKQQQQQHQTAASAKPAPSKQRAPSRPKQQQREQVTRSESSRRLFDDLDETTVDSSGADQFANCDAASFTSTGASSIVGASGAAPAGNCLGCGADTAGGLESAGGGFTRSLLTKNLVWAVFASAVGSSFQHGYNGGVVNAPQKLIGEFVNATYKQRHNEWATEAQVDFVIALIVSIFCIGGCLGALLTAFVADRFGRKEGLMYNNLLVLVACPLMASARSMSSYELLIIGRLIIGINAGLNAGLAPLYLNEIAPVQLRGALGTIYQLVITISILLSNIFGLPNLLGDTSSWPILFALPILPAAFMLCALPHCCESPKHLLLNQGKELQAQQALAWLRHTGDVQEEMEELRNERELNILMNNRQITLADMLAEQSMRRPLTIAIVVMLSQQLSGINAVLFYSTSIFRDAGLSEIGAVQATLGMGLINVAMTLVSLFLVDRAGRRTLHMTGLMGMAAACLVLALCLSSSASSAPGLSSSLAVVAVYVFIAMFASGPGAIPWFLVAELFPSNARPLASSIAVAVNWLANFTVSLCFLPLTNLLHGFTFVLFAMLLVIFYLFTYYKIPETKGATAEEISALFRRIE